MLRRIIRTVAVALVVLAAAVAASAAPVRADDGPAPAAECPGPDVSSLAGVDCDRAPLPEGVDPADTDPADTPAVIARAAAVSAAAAALPHQCRYHAEEVFYTERDWLRLARILSEDTSFCADFYLTVPPVVADKTKPRPLEAGRIAAFGPMFHPMAETHWATWAGHVTGSLTPKYPSFYDAGVEAGERAIAAGYELWALNEVPAAVRQGNATLRANIAQFLIGLRDGSGVPGLVFVTGVGQRTSPLDVYHTNLQNWLYDGLFWSAIAPAVRFWGQEVYGDVRAWAVPDANRNDRTRHLADYLMHSASLVGTLGDAAQPARDLLERTFVPIGNVVWPAAATTGFGFTDVALPLMESYVSEQVYAVRHYAGTHPGVAPDGRFGAAYSPRTPIDVDGQGAILTRLASALHEAYEEGGGTQMGACGVPGDRTWCDGSLDGSAFVDGWDAF